MVRFGTYAVAVAVAVLLTASLSAGADQQRSTNSGNYPAVEDVPPRPEKPAMTAEEQSKLKKELSAARDRQAPKGKAKAGAMQGN